jgi:hypothetical protein
LIVVQEWIAARQTFLSISYREELREGEGKSEGRKLSEELIG